MEIAVDFSSRKQTLMKTNADCWRQGLIDGQNYLAKQFTD